MMAADKPDVISLSFVDVLANGLGSIVALFLIVTILRQGLELTERSSARPTDTTQRLRQPVGQRRPPEKDPFVILVTSEDDQPLRAEQADYRWEYPEDLGGRPNGGGRFAALYLSRPPADQMVTLAGLRAGTRVVVRVWSQEGERPPRVGTVEPQGRIVVWPESMEAVRP